MEHTCLSPYPRPSASVAPEILYDTGVSSLSTGEGPRQSTLLLAFRFSGVSRFLTLAAFLTCSHRWLKYHSWLPFRFWIAWAHCMSECRSWERGIWSWLRRRSEPSASTWGRGSQCRETGLCAQWWRGTEPGKQKQRCGEHLIGVGKGF